MRILRKSKNIVLVFTVLFAFLLVLSGCSQKQATGNITNPGQAGAPGGRGSKMLDFGQPSRQADIRGIVKSIVGNEVDILKVDIRGGRGGNNASSTEASSTNPSNNQAPVASLNVGGNGAPSGQGGNRQGGGNRGFGGQGGQGGAGGAPVDRTAMLAQLKAMSTGEDKIIIPVGIKMLKTSIDTNTKQRTAVEATLSDVTADKTITIWLDSSVTDKKVAEFVLIN